MPVHWGQQKAKETLACAKQMIDLRNIREAGPRRGHLSCDRITAKGGSAWKGKGAVTLMIAHPIEPCQ